MPNNYVVGSGADPIAQIEAEVAAGRARVRELARRTILRSQRGPECSPQLRPAARA